MDLQLVFKTDNILFYKVSIELIDEYLELVNDKFHRNKQPPA